MIIAHIAGDRIFSTSPEAFSLCERSHFGEKRQGRIEFSPIEALFLILEKKMELRSDNKALTEEQVLRKIKRFDKGIDVKLPVFTDLRKKGYIVKTALKFGAEFRVYEKGGSPGKEHARWILFPVRESAMQSWYDIAAKNRVAHAAKKKILIGIVDDEGDVTYFELAWVRP